MVAHIQKLCGKSDQTEYIKLLRCNRNYRLYFLAHSMQHVGDWLIRVAVLLSIQRLAPGSSTSISIVLLCHILPSVLITPAGGVLSDNFDRKHLMVSLDVIAAVITLGFILALRSGNVYSLYAATLIRASISALYEPITKSIFPMFLKRAEDLKQAAMLNTISWSMMLLLGGICGGYAAAIIGIEACYVVDSITYFWSAFIISRINGRFSVAQTFVNEDRPPSHDGLAWPSKFRYGIRSIFKMTKDFLLYLFSSGFTLCVLMKACGSMLHGGQDVLNVGLSLVEGDEKETIKRVGILYSCGGLGCLIGPILSNTFTKSSYPSTIQLASIGAFAIIFPGWFGIGSAPSFELICFFSLIRSMGDSIVWMNSTLLLQTLTRPAMLGRMLAFEFSISKITEAFMSLVVGHLIDSGYSKYDVASFLSLVGAIFLFLWSIYHCFGGGAANRKFIQTSVGIKGNDSEESEHGHDHGRKNVDGNVIAHDEILDLLP